MLVLLTLIGCEYECVDLGQADGCRPIEECCTKYGECEFVVEGPRGVQRFECAEDGCGRKALADATDAACDSI
jgi:hypothetical protein